MVDSGAMGPRLEQVNIVAGDVDAAAAFYRRLGVEIEDGPPEWAAHHRNGRGAGADVDVDSEAFAAVWNEGWPGGTGLVLGFRVDSRDDVDRLYDELTGAGHVGQQPPWDAFWGSRFAVVTDPAGNAVALMSPADAAHRSPVDPPDPPG